MRETSGGRETPSQAPLGGKLERGPGRPPAGVLAVPGTGENNRDFKIQVLGPPPEPLLKT